MQDLPYTFDVPLPSGVPTRYDQHTVRRLSALEGYYADAAAYAARLAQEDVILYDVYELRRPENAGELLHGLTILHPGKVGDEFYFTKGHFHAVLETAEVYYCLHGQGVMLMETPEGDCAAEVLCPGRVLYVPPRWAHRSVNTERDEDLILLYVYPAHAGHDYSTIEARGFCQLVVERDGRPQVVDNPRRSDQQKSK
jgi:glucose-6-phosphate isomerase